MQFIIGLILGGALMFGWHYTQCVPKSMLIAERATSKAALESVRAVSAAELVAAKAKIKDDYDVALKAAEARVAGANADLLAARAESNAAKAEAARLTEEAKTLKSERVKAQPTPTPVAKAPVVAPKPEPAPVVVQPAPAPAYVKPAPKASTFGAARPSSIKDGATTGRYRLQRKMDGSVITNYY